MSVVILHDFILAHAMAVDRNWANEAMRWHCFEDALSEAAHFQVGAPNRREVFGVPITFYSEQEGGELLDNLLVLENVMSGEAIILRNPQEPPRYVKGWLSEGDDSGC